MSKSLIPINLLLRVKELSSNLGEAKSVVVSAYSELTVNQDHGLRGELREANVNYKVVKKTLLMRALEEAKLEGLNLNDVQGNIGVATGEDETSAAKVLHTFAKGNKKLSIVAGYLENKLIDSAMISSLAMLPSKDEMLSKTLATMNAPIQSFVGVLSGTTRKLLYALNAIKESKS